MPSRSAISVLPIVLLIVLVGLAPRLIFLAEWYRPGSWNLPVVDALEFESDALRILEGRPNPQVYWHAPGMPYFIAGIYAATGWVPQHVAVAQALLGAWTCVAAYFLARRWLGERWALVPAAVCALYGPLIYYEGQLLRPSLFTALLTSWFWVAVEAGARRSWRWHAAGGVLLGACALVRETALILVPVACWWALRSGSGAGVKAWPRVWAAALGTLLVVAPVTVRNAVVGHEFVPISSSGGINFYIGNQPHAAQLQAAGPGTAEWSEITALPRRMGGALTPGERSDFFYREGWAYWTRDPLGAAGTTLHKTLALFTAHEIPRNQSIYEGREHSRVLAALLWKWGGFAFPFGVLGPLALVGLLFGLRRHRELVFLGVTVGIYALGIIAFFPVARYRVPLVPFLACLATVGVIQVWEALRARRVVPVLAVLAGAVVLVDGGWVQARWNPATGPFTRAWTHQQRGRPAAAIAELENTLDLDPEHQEALANLAALYGMRGDAAQAASIARRALALNPDGPKAWINLANAQIMLGHPAEAESSLTRALTLQPDSPEAWTALLRLVQDPGRSERVLRLARLATETWPRDPTGWVRYGHVLLEAGRLDEAEAALQMALRANAGTREARVEFDRLNAARGRAGH
jgi:tetratricopeptide (TPR) repeat protein